MDLRGSLIGFAFLFACTLALPTSLLEDVKANEIRDNKVKRAHDGIHRSEESLREPVAYYSNPTAIKRGTNLKNENADQGLNEWEQERDPSYRNPDLLPSNLASNLYSTDDGDDKTIAEYEKGFQYGTNKEKLDEALENAVLKSELYGEPAALNQYRYFGGGAEERRRKRRGAKKIILNNRLKRDIELSPEEILTILTLWENDRRRQNEYHPTWTRYEPTDLDQDNDRDENGVEQDDESWLDRPVYPHATGHLNQFGNDVNRPASNYYYDDKRDQWTGFSDNKKKRFMVARKRNDPTRELRYLNGLAQNRNDYYTLAELLGSSQRDPNVPLYHRMVL